MSQDNNVSDHSQIIKGSTNHETGSQAVSNIENITSHRLKIEKIKESIKNLNNNYFENNYNESLLQYLNMFEEYDETYLIDKLVILKKYIRDKIINKCDHNWINDVIDIDPDRSQQICYCVKCEVTKK